MRLSLDQKLAAIHRLRDQPSSPDSTAELRRGLSDKSNLVVAAAAVVAGEQAKVELADALESAYPRFLVEPLKNDKLCRAKIAIIQALDKLEHDRPDLFQQAARHVQFEPVWGGRADSASPLRVAAIVALTRIGGSDVMPLLVDALTDPEKDVRGAAAQALGCIGHVAADPVLRLKARLGDADADVVSECLSGLLAIDPRENLSFVSGFLDTANPARCEAAVLALGKSRLPEALDALKDCWPRATASALRQQILLGISMLRLPAATDYLLEIVAAAPETDALAALSALKIHNYDQRLRPRIAEVIRKRGSKTLQSRFERDFPAEGSSDRAGRDG
jgi:HEAT repeat protein